MADLEITDLTATTVPAFDDELELQLAGGGASRKALLRHLLRSLTVTHHTSGFSISAGSATGECHTNYGASAAMTASLPAATAGMIAHVLRIAAYQVTVDPNGSETIQGGGSGKAVYMLGAGMISLRCFVDGAWMIIGESAPWNFEP